MVDPLGGETVTHTRHTRYVIGGLTAQCGQIGVLARGDMVFVLHGLRGHGLEFLEMIARVQHRDVVIDELECITISGQHIGAVIRMLPHRGQCGDHIVALVSLLGHIGHTERLKHVLDERNLRDEFFGGCFTCAFVLGEHLVAEGAPLHVEGHAEQIGLLRCDDLRKHREEAVDRIGGLTVFGREILRWQCVERTECQRMAINHQQRSPGALFIRFHYPPVPLICHHMKT